MSGSAHNVCLPLPNTITNSVMTYESRVQFLVKYLERVLPSSDNKTVVEELKRTFIFDKCKLHSNKSLQESGVSAKNRGLRKRRHTRPKILGSKHGLQYKELLGLNEMWLDYLKQQLRIKEFIDLPKSPLESNWENINERLARADFHGAVVSVVRSKNPVNVGASGIVLMETKNSFQILSTKNQLRTIPKDSSLFRIHLPHASLEFLGSEMQHRPAERSVKKFKASHFCNL